MLDAARYQHSDLTDALARIFYRKPALELDLQDLEAVQDAAADALWRLRLHATLNTIGEPHAPTE